MPTPPPPIRPRVQHAPTSPASGARFAAAANGSSDERAAADPHYGSGETGRYLRRSWALIEQMRHAVEARRRG